MELKKEKNELELQINVTKKMIEEITLLSPQMEAPPAITYHIADQCLTANVYQKRIFEPSAETKSLSEISRASPTMVKVKNFPLFIIIMKIY